MRKRAKSSYGTSRRTNKPTYCYSTYLIQRFDNLSKYFKMTIYELLQDKDEQGTLTTTLTTMIDRLKLIKPKTQRAKSKNSNLDFSNDSFIGKNPIPMMSRLKKSKYNGIPRPTRALTAKYRPNIPRPRPTSVSAKDSVLKAVQNPSHPILKNSFMSASSHSFVKPVITKLSSMTSESTKSTFLVLVTCL